MSEQRTEELCRQSILSADREYSEERIRNSTHLKQSKAMSQRNENRSKTRNKITLIHVFRCHCSCDGSIGFLSHTTVNKRKKWLTCEERIWIFQLRCCLSATTKRRKETTLFDDDEDSNEEEIDSAIFLFLTVKTLNCLSTGALYFVQFILHNLHL